MPKIGPVPGGINNKAQRGRLPRSERGQQLFAYNANNMVFNDQGGAFSIDGPEPIYTGTDLKDGFSCSVGSYFREGSKIKRIYAGEDGNITADELCSGIVGDRIAWAEFNSTVYFSDGIVCKKIKDHVVSSWGVQPPTGKPVLSGSSVLGSGQIMACYTYLLDDGTESGSSPVVVANSGRVLSNIKRSDDPRVAAIKCYLTGPNNDTFFHAATILNGDVSAEITTDYRNGEECLTRGKIPPVPSRLITPHAGSLYMASGNLIYFTDPHSLDLVSIGESITDTVVQNIWQLVGDVTLLAAVTDGIYVGSSDGTYWVNGNDPYNAQLTLVDESIPEIGAVRKVQTGEVIWRSDAGFIKGYAGGRTERMTFENVSVDDSSKGETAMGLMNINGVEAVIGVPQSPTPGKLQGKEWVSDFINKKC